MNETQQNTAESQVAAPAAAEEAVVATPAKAKGRFDEQIGLMSPTDAAKVQAQLDLTPGADSAVFEIVEAHGGGFQVLYKTYDQSVTARNALKAKDDASSAVLPIAKATLGKEYCNGDVVEGVCQGEKEVFTIGKLAEFQATGLIVVMAVIIGLCLLCYLMNFIMAKLGLNVDKAPAPAVKAAPAAAAPAAAPAAAAPRTIGPAHCDWDPNAKSVHPGMTNKQLQAFLSIAAIAALEEHPGLTNDELVVIMTAAATQVLGQPCRVTAYKNVNSPAWTIV
ncbi:MULTISPECIES: hypothetical protein [unclassified Fibrobacter]|uniref:hypothetical protein n=1 Tax=unclassified Fibrobacter TaxID=2634177 RepID=UPI000D6D5C96|nr:MULTISPECIES: hypothetical protein [unclassified Fibrobacter]PWJ64938.1 oxaloacetate decarboxylase gamma subunit [Fibrobacter sp. UWR4]PZW69003.1 oxaloacetate decarboxylase gamma subunit [Fibrobacter sp. UWR1]